MKLTAKRDFLLGLSILALALLVLFWLIPLAVKAPQNVPNIALSPSFWPRIIVVSLAGLGALLMLRSLHDNIKGAPASSEDEDNLPAFEHSDLWVAVAAGFMIVFSLLLQPLGVVLPSMLLLFALVLLHNRRKVVGAAVISVALVLCLYLFFRYVARIPIPLGPLSRLLG